MHGGCTAGVLDRSRLAAWPPIFEDGQFLTRRRFVDAIRTALSSAGVDQQKYCGHSFHIGVATTAAARGIEDTGIKTLGRRESVAYLQYVCIPSEGAIVRCFISVSSRVVLYNIPLISMYLSSLVSGCICFKMCIGMVAKFEGLRFMLTWG